MARERCPTMRHHDWQEVGGCYHSGLLSVACSVVNDTTKSPWSASLGQDWGGRVISSLGLPAFGSHYTGRPACRLRTRRRRARLEPRLAALAGSRDRA